MTTTLPSGEKIQALDYTYDPAGNPTLISNALAPLTGSGGAMPGASTLTLTYDDIGRLLSASGQAELQPGTTTTYNQQFTHTSSHNLSTKSRVHLVTNPGGSQAPPETNFSSGYTYLLGRPHLVDIVGELKFTYDPSGNPLARHNLTTGAQQTLVWDDDNRLVDVTSNGVHQHNTYDASGLRVRRKSGSRETVFSSPYFDVEDNTQGIKHVFAGSTRIATALGSFASGTDPADPDVPAIAYYFHGDHLGSTSVLSDEDGAVHQSLEYFADGETWIDRAPQTPVNGYLFNGKPFDADTGFYDYGQRFYDPRTSLWLGLDPALTDSPDVALGRPLMLAHGAYAAHSPLRFIDPDGRAPDGYGDMIACHADRACSEPWRRKASVPGLSVGTRIKGAVKVIGGGAGFSAGAAMCSSLIGCIIGIPLMIFSADVGGSGVGESVTGTPQPTVGGQLLGPTTQAIEEAIVGGAGLLRAMALVRNRTVGGAGRSSDAHPKLLGSGVGRTLNETVGDRTADVVREVLKGRQPLSALTVEQRTTAAAFYRDVATRTGGAKAGAASRYNVARAEFLEGTRSSISPTLPEFIKKGF